MGLVESDALPFFSLGNVGGNSDNASNGNAGPSYLNANNSLSDSNDNNGARLALCCLGMRQIGFLKTYRFFDGPGPCRNRNKND